MSMLCAQCGIPIPNSSSLMCNICSSKYAEVQMKASIERTENRRREQEKQRNRKIHNFYHRECTECAEEVKLKAKKCIHCGHEFPDYEEKRAFITMREIQVEELGCELWESREEVLEGIRKEKEKKEREKLQFEKDKPIREQKERRSKWGSPERLLIRFLSHDMPYHHFLLTANDDLLSEEELDVKKKIIKRLKIQRIAWIFFVGPLLVLSFLILLFG
jgi:hypothetical protein